MEAVNPNLLVELTSLSKEAQEKVLIYIKKLKKKDKKSEGTNESKPGFGGMKNVVTYVSENLHQVSVAEDFEEYL